MTETSSIEGTALARVGSERSRWRSKAWHSRVDNDRDRWHWRDALCHSLNIS